MYNNKSYSPNNKKLIYEACPNAKYIMGKGEFKAKHDHVVLDDEKPIEIMAPVFDEDTNKITGFERVYVYDISQTRPILGEDKKPTAKAKELIDFIEGNDGISELIKKNEHEELVNKLLAEADLEEVNQQNFDELEM